MLTREDLANMVFSFEHALRNIVVPATAAHVGFPPQRGGDNASAAVRTQTAGSSGSPAQAGFLSSSSQAGGSSVTCKYFARGSCRRGLQCEFRHAKAQKQVVCKHWIRGLCKKGERCEFLHVYDKAKMPHCVFFASYGHCLNTECEFLHVKPNEKVEECLLYARGFCPDGPLCTRPHSRASVCAAFLAGFCLLGKACAQAHPKFEILSTDLLSSTEGQEGAKPSTNRTSFAVLLCHGCGLPGHLASTCSWLGYKRSLSSKHRSVGFALPTKKTHANNNILQKEKVHPSNELPSKKRPLHSVMCFKCGDYGHYANACSSSARQTAKKNVKISFK